MKHRAYLPGLAVFLLLPAAAQAVLYYFPPWVGELHTTYQRYNFAESAIPAATSVVTNGYGVPPAAQIKLGEYGEGWMNPSNIYHLAGEDGAWDLGKSGTITSSVPFAAGSGQYRVDLFLDVLAYEDIHQLPTLWMSGSAVMGASYSVSDHKDPVFGGFWKHVIWTGSVEVAGSPSLTTVVTANANYGSCVDSLAIQTRYAVIPEPSTLAGWSVCMAVLAIRRRLRRAAGVAQAA